MNMIFKIVSIGILLPYCSVLIKGQSNVGTCSADWQICEATGECVPNSCQDTHLTPSTTPCGYGQIYCAEAGACVPACPGRLAALSRSEQVTSCDGELVYCLSQSACMPSSQCGDKQNSQSCPSGTFFCLSTGRCQKSACGPVQGHASCPVGLVFCVVTGKCQLSSCLRGLTHRQSRPTTFLVPLRRCRAGKVFDENTGNCIDKYDPQNLFKIEASSTCIDGMIFCTSIGACTEESMCDDLQSLSNQSTANPDIVKCQTGKVFCLATNTCTWPNRCTDNPSSFRSERLIDCPNGKVFCLSTGTCEMEGNCGSRPEHTYGTMCPRGYVYCIEKQECVPTEKGCGDTGTTLKCEPGTVFCPDKGQCSADCSSTAVLWRPELECPIENSTFNYSNCITSNQCPYGYNCCPDPVTLHHQCIGPNDTIPADVLSTISCPMLYASGEDSDIGVTCLNSPSECPPASLCCNGTCMTPRGTNQCPPTTLFCSVTKKCEKLGSSCGKVCPPEKVYCIASDECKAPAQCEFHLTSGAPWMLPGPVILSTTGFMNPVAQKLNYLFDVNGTVVQDTNLVVQNMMVGKGFFQTKKLSTDTWTNVADGSVFGTSDYLQYLPGNGTYSFGLAFLNVTEQDSGIPRLIVQLLSPEPPEIQFTLRESSLTTLEDEMQMMKLGELFKIVDSNWVYWDAWKKALDLPAMSAKLGLIDFTHPTTLAWVRSLTRPDFETIGRDDSSQVTSKDDSSSVKRGLKIEYGHEQALSDEPAIFLDVSTDEGRSWSPVNSETPRVIYVSKGRSLADTLLRMLPARDAYGNTSFLFTPFVHDSLQGNSNYTKSIQKKLTTQKLNVVILPMNDAPMALAGVDLASVPTMSPTISELKLTANQLASIFYTDVDGDQLGVAVFHSHSSEFGNWTYSEDSGATWHDITFLEENPLHHAGMLISGRYQGFIMSDAGDPLKSPETLASLTASGNASIPPQMTPHFNRSHHSNSTMQHNQSVYYDGISGINRTNNYNAEINALLLPPNTILKFKAKNSTHPWTIADSIKKSRLIFTAWDTSDVKFESIIVQRKNLSLTNCTPECGGFGSFADVHATILADWKGCDGGEVLDGTMKVVDRCGVCGGDGQSCVDCHFVVNGTAKLDCGQCIGGTTGIVSVRDCAGECGNNNILKQFPEGQVCIPKSAANMLPCDNSTNSGAYINECGVCVGGTTNRTKDALKDQCGMCYGTNECVGCDGIPFSGKVYDLCGHCMAENDTTFNQGCSTIGNFIPETEDVAVISASNPSQGGTTADYIDPSLSVFGMVVGVSPSSYKLDNCSFINNINNQTITDSHAVFQNGKLKLSIITLKVGSWNVSCNFEVVNGSQTTANNRSTSRLVTVQSSKPLTVVNSTSVAIESVDKTQISLHNESEITIILKNNVDLNGGFCILLYKPLVNRPQYVVKMDKLRTNNGNNITCKLNPMIRIGSAALSVVLSESLLDAVKSNKIVLPSVPVEVMAAAPKVLGSKLSPFGTTLVIKFDINIEMSGNCTNNFINSAIFGQGAVCQIHSSELWILLGNSSSVTNGTTITFSQPNAIIQRYGQYATQAPKVSGSTVVLQDPEEETLRFSIVGDNRACNGSTVKLEAVLDQIPNSASYQVIWNITWLKNDLYYDQNEVLKILNSTQAIQAIANSSHKSRVLIFNGSMLISNVSYLIIATLQGPYSYRIEPQKFRVRSAPAHTAFLVNIKGSTNVYADKLYTYQTDIKYCKPRPFNISTLDNTYFWSVNKPTSPLHVSYSSPSIDLQPGTLRAKNNYTLSALIVDSNDESGLGTLDITTITQSVKAVIGTQHMTVGSSAAFVLDGSGSINPNGPASDLNFRWSCDMKDGTKCFTSQSMQRFENAIPTETLLSNALIVPPILSPNTYKFTLEVSNADSSNNATTTVTILPGILPQLFVRAPTGLVDVNQTVNVYGFVTAPSAVRMWWESIDEAGYEFVDIYAVASAAKEVTTIGSSNFRPLTLTLPPPSAGWRGLKPGSRYKFRLSASLNGGPASQADAVIQTKSPPISGSLVVSPSRGEALITNFTMTAIRWTDSPDDLPLTASFGYMLKDSGNVVWLDKKVGSNLTLQTVFTASSPTTKIIPLLMICDTTLACNNIQGSEIIVSLPSTLPDSTLIHLSESLSKQFEQDANIINALAKSGEVLATLQALRATTQLRSLVDILEFHMAAKVESLKERLNSDPNNVQTQQAAKDMLSATLNILQDGYPFSMNIFYSLFSLSENLIAALTNTPPPKTTLASSSFPPSRRVSSDNIVSTRKNIDFEATINTASPRRRKIQFYPQEDSPNAIAARTSLPATSRVKQAIMSIVLGDDNPYARLKRSLTSDQTEYSSSKINPRFKRQLLFTPNNMSTVNYTALTVKEVTNLLTIGETNVLNAQTQSNKTVAMDKLTRSLDVYIAGLCLSMTTEDQPQEVHGNLVSIRVFKSQLLNNEDGQRYKIADAHARAQDFINVSSYIVWGPIIDQYKQWNCDPSNSGVICYGICLATLEFDSLFSSPNVRAYVPGSKGGHLIRTALLHPTKGYEIKPLPSANPLSFSLAIRSTSVGQNEVLKCFGWVKNQWNSSVCSSVQLSSTSNNTSTFSCSCPNTGYLNTFVVSATQNWQNGGVDLLFSGTPHVGNPPQIGTPATTQMPSLYHVKNITMKLDGDYNTSVLNRETLFKEEISNQVAVKLNLTVRNVRVLAVRPGSIVVDMQLIENNATRAGGAQGSIDSVYNYLVEAINSGDLTFTGLDNEKLRVLPGDGTSAAVDQTYLPILIGGIVGGSLMIAIVIVVLAFYLNRKKRMEKVSPINQVNLPPTYRAIHFEHSLNSNTFPKKQQSGSNSAKGWDPNMAAYTDDGLYIERNSALSHAKPNSGAANEVPQAFNYKSPTKQQLESSVPIPEHILEQLKKTSVPGTPDH